MAFSRPTFDELVTRIRGDLRSQLLAAGLQATLLRRTKMWVLAYVYATIFHILYDDLVWISKQILPSSATDFDYLRDFGTDYAVTPLDATKAEGVVRFTGDDTTVIPSGTPFVREDGEAYVTTQGGTVGSSVSGQVDVAAEAVEAGDDGNMDADTVLTLSSPISGVDSAITIVSGWTAATDDETMEPYRNRVLERMAFNPHGGAKEDYILWARQVAGIFRALAVANARGPGTVDVYVLHDEGTAGIGLPTGEQIAAVQAHIDGDYVRPVLANVVVKAPTSVPVAVTFSSLDPDDSETRAAIVVELDGLFQSIALVEGKETLSPSQVYAAVQAATGVVGFDLDAPASPMTVGEGEAFILGTVTWPS